MTAMKKYTVSPNLNYWSSEVAKTSKSFKEKKEALQYADELINKGCKTTHFITDYYLNNECIKSEFARYNGEKIEIYCQTHPLPQPTANLMRIFLPTLIRSKTNGAHSINLTS